MTKVSLGLIAITSFFLPACTDDGAALEPARAPATQVACGPAEDALAARLEPQLGGKLAGHLTGDAVACARVIVESTRAFGLDEHAAQIAITTAITESGLANLTVIDASDAVGLFAQRPSRGAGLPDQLIAPTFATNTFLASMATAFPDDGWMTTSIGVVAQTVQETAAPEAFEAQASDGEVLAHALWSPPADLARAR